MPRTKKKPTNRSRKPAATPPPAPSGEVLTLAEAAAYLRFSESDVLRLIHEQKLPARQLGAEFRFLKSALQDWLRTPPLPGSKEAQLAVAGIWKDDPDLEEMLKEIYRQRGRPTTEDGE